MSRIATSRVPNNFEKVTLQKVKLAATQYLAGEALQNLEITTWPDRISNALAYQLRTFVMGEKVHEIEKSVSFEYPATWWEHLKWNHAPTWFKTRYPVKMKKFKRTVKFEQIQCFPKMNQMLPKDEQQYEFTHLNAIEDYRRSPFED